MHLSKGHLFRVTRDADVEIRDDKAADLLALIKESLRERRFGLPVRLEVSSSMPSEMVEYLTNSLDIEPDDVYEIDGLLDVPDLMELYSLDHAGAERQTAEARSCLLRCETRSRSSTRSKSRTCCCIIRTPSFGTVVDFIQAAAHDPKVVAIKMCLYRTGKNSPIPQALIEASERGKQVTAVVEIKARFDEEHNIEWAKRLAESGVHVVYGIVGLKTHSKVALVVQARRRWSSNLHAHRHRQLQPDDFEVLHRPRIADQRFGDRRRRD